MWFYRNLISETSYKQDLPPLPTKKVEVGRAVSFHEFSNNLLTQLKKVHDIRTKKKLQK